MNWLVDYTIEITLEHAMALHALHAYRTDGYFQVAVSQNGVTRFRVIDREPAEYVRLSASVIFFTSPEYVNEIPHIKPIQAVDKVWDRLYG